MRQYRCRSCGSNATRTIITCDHCGAGKYTQKTKKQQGHRPPVTDFKLLYMVLVLGLLTGAMMAISIQEKQAEASTSALSQTAKLN